MRAHREALDVPRVPGAPIRLAVAAVVTACALAVPVRLSADVWAYAAYGALVTHGVDPWAHALQAAEVAALRDPVLAAALRAWDGSLPRDVYGPLFTLPCAAIVSLTRPLGVGGTIAALRVLAVLALLACVALASRARPQLASLLAFHPVILWSAAEGHNDAMWLALVLASERARAAAPRIAALVAATAVKAIAVVPLVLALVRVRRARAAVIAVACAALALAYAPLAWSVFAHGLDRGAGAPRVSLVHGPALAACAHAPALLTLAGALALAGVAGVSRAFRAGDRRAGLALGAWLLLPAPEPWYAVWLAPVIAASGRTPAAWALLAASFTGLAGYVPDVAGTSSPSPALLGGTMLALYALPILLALAQPSSPNPLPQPSPAPAQPAPSPSPAPAPSATTTPVPPSPQPGASASPFAYVVAAPPGNGTPRIAEVALNDRVMHQGGMLLVRVTTTPDVTTVVARTMGHEIGIPQGAPGSFAGQSQIPSGIPFFLLNRTYQIEFVASTADGHSATFTIPIRLER